MYDYKDTGQVYFVAEFNSWQEVICEVSFLVLFPEAAQNSCVSDVRAKILISLVSMYGGQLRDGE